MPNNLTNVMPKLLAQGLMALRATAVLPRLVNRDYDSLAAQRGATIDVPIPSAIVAVDVTAANTPPATSDVAPTTAPVTLNIWKEAAFYMTDRDVLESQAGTIPMQASEAIKALADGINLAILGKFEDFQTFAGVPGTTPFSASVIEYTKARAVANANLAPMQDRRVVLDPDAEGNALGLRAFQDASFRGDTAGIIEGAIGRKLGADWYMHQLVKEHAQIATGSFLLNAAGAKGSQTITVDGGGTKPALGDIFKITAAGTTQYMFVSRAGGVWTIFPSLQKAEADNAAVVLSGNYRLNALFHRDAIAFATRPLQSSDPAGVGNFMSAADPESGLTLRLEVTREHKRTRYSYDALYGVGTVRQQLGVRLVG